MSDLLTCKHQAEAELCDRGLENFDEIRHIDTWDHQQIRYFARAGDVASLPRVSDSIRRLVGQNVLLYELIVDEKEQLTMSQSELMNAWFSVGGVVVGEAGNITHNFESVMLSTVTGVNLHSVW